MKKLFFLTIALFVAIAANAQFDYTETSIYTLPLNQVFTNLVNCEFNQTFAPQDGNLTGKNDITLTTGGTEASFNMGPAVKWTYTSSTDGHVIAKQYGTYVQPNGRGRVITITAAAGTKVIINVVEAISADGVTMTGILGDFAGFEAGANEFTATGNVVITTVSEKPKFSAIITQISVSISDDCSKNGPNQNYIHTYIDGYEYVDLGLSVKWAAVNVGATNPEDYGNYYAWGEVTPKTDYSWSTYLWCNGSYDTLTKYCTQSSYGTVDNKTTLEPADDAAHVNWGGNWRTPTDAEWKELQTQCIWTWTTQNGVEGYRVTANNGNSIFLPAAGCHHDADLIYVGSYGYYWSSSLPTDKFARYVRFHSSGVGVSWTSRNYGQSVRPVCP